MNRNIEKLTESYQTSFSKGLLKAFLIFFLVLIPVIVWFTFFVPSFEGTDYQKDSEEAYRAYQQITQGTHSPSPPYQSDEIFNVHFWARGFEDHTYLLKFNFSDSGGYKPIIDRFGLNKINKEKELELSSSRPKWWDRNQIQLIYTGGYSNLFVTLWIDTLTKTAYYEEYSQ